MAPPVALAKTTRPTPGGVLPRRRLFAALDRRRHAPLVWICGPPGAGKTTLIASYLEAHELDSRWYQLDRGDSDLGTFCYYMARAATGSGERGDEGPPLYTSEYHGDPGAFARRYFAKVFGALEVPFVLVLDNYQEVAPESGFHQALIDGLAEIPGGGSVVVVSRAEPPPSLARLRANRQLEVLGWPELALTRSESDAIVDDWRPGCGEPVREQLYHRTQGWAAALILLLDQASAAGWERLAEPGAPAVVFDYLANEIVDNLDAATRELLLATSFLPEMTPAMAAELGGQPAAAEILAGLRRAHHLIGEKAGEEGPVYQVHPLLRELLRSRAGVELAPERLQALRRHAARLLEGEGRVDEAITLARVSGDRNELARLVHQHAEAILRQGRTETLERWLDALAEERLDDDPWFDYWRAICRFHTSHREARLLHQCAFESFHRHPAPDPTGLALACSGAMDTLIYELDDLAQLDRWIAEAEALLTAHRDTLPRPVRARLSVSLFLSLVFRQPHHPDLPAHAAEAHERLHEIDDDNARLTAALLMVITLNYTGQFERARQFVEQMRRTCRRGHVSPLALKVLKDVESMYYMFTADYERCLGAVEAGIEIGRESGVRLWSYHLLSNGAAAALGAGDLDVAQARLAEMREHQDSARRLDLCIYHYYEAWLALSRADALGAYRAQRAALRLAVESGCPYYEILCRLALGQVLIALGEVGRARTELRMVRRRSKAVKNRLLEFQIGFGYAQLAYAEGRERLGRAALARALRIGREHGFIHFPCWIPTVMSELCARALAAGLEPDYVRELVRARDLAPPRRRIGANGWPWPLQIAALGDLRFVRDGRALRLRAKLRQRPVELLKTLLAMGATNVDEERLAGVMWPRIDLVYALRSLTTTLHRLRKLLGEERALRHRHGRLGIDERYCWLDVREFDALCTHIEHTVAGTDREGDARVDGEEVQDLADRLLVLYRGPFLAAEPDEPRFEPERVRLRARLLAAVGGLTRRWEALGENERCAAYLGRALETAPLDEALYRRLMLCHRALGHTAEALEVYEQCRVRLASELDASPSAETRAVFDRLAREI